MKNLKIKEEKDKNSWNKLFNNFGSPSFLQVWEWGEVQKRLGYEVIRLVIKEKNHPIALAQTIKISAKRGKFLFIPHGPIIDPEKYNPKTFRIILKTLLEKLKKTAKKERYSFIRIAPIVEDRVEERKIFENLGFFTAPIYMHAERAWVLALEKDEEELLKEMRKTTRNLIRKALKLKELIVEKRNDPEALEIFYKIYLYTAKNQKFTPFSKKFIKSEFEEFKKNSLFIFTKYKKDYLAGALIIFTKSSGFYHQGASIHSKIPATYLLQWEAIKEAKKRGCKYYNFWGIYRPGRSPKSWKGLSFFKQGFGGFQIDYLPTQDYIISPKYYLTWLYEKYLAFKRGI